MVRNLVEQPTAPFHEDAVRNAIVAELQKCPHVSIEYDRYGNVIAAYHRKTRMRPRWAFAAHMDHPGWVRGRDGEWHFLGSVKEQFLVNPRRRDFGKFAMWDLPHLELKNDQIHSRACDDLLGCAEIICLFQELEARKASVHCLGLFTRAEEVGFWGAIRLAALGIVPKEVTILSLETSTPKGGAEIGRGPIVRVGDRLSIFDSEETARIMRAATDHKIPAQRCLLDGGACEASAYQLYGYRSTAMSIALGNYHNCAPDGTIQCEYVSIDDYANTVRLCLSLVCAPAKADPGRELRKTLERRAATHQPYFRPLARPTSGATE